MKQKKIWLPLVALLLLTMACQFSYGTDIAQAPTSAVRKAASTPQLATLSPMTTAPIIQLDPNDELLVALYQHVNPGVVAIQTVGQQGAGLGSGFVFDRLGHIVTNYHVVEGAEDLEVDFPSGYKVRGTVIGTDLDSDLAVIEVDVPADELTVLPLGDSEKLQVGQTVVAIGNPFGLSSTMTLGIISAKGRTLESLRQTSDGDYFWTGDIIQTDASINPGNSGGPLLNLNGEVVGVNRAIRTTGVSATGELLNSGIGFAVSVNIVRRVVPVLIEQGAYDYPYLGISAREELSLMEQEILGLSQTTGAYILSIEPGSPADEAGLKGGTRTTEITNFLAGGDLIIAVDQRPVRVFGDVLGYMLTQKSPGDSMEFTILRDGEEKEVTVILGKRP
ncbi:MAG: PDZ domain-containing protein [Chloroflexi bacterium]|nr:PDZ domain-containing protein [Chloroflexota bacterium]